MKRAPPRRFFDNIIAAVWPWSVSGQRRADNKRKACRWGLDADTRLEPHRLHRMLAEINVAIAQRENVNALAKEICRIAHEAGGFSHVWIGEVDPKAKVLRPMGWAGGESDEMAAWLRALSFDPDTPEGRGPSAKAAKAGTAVVINKVKDDPAAAPWCRFARKFGIASALSMPLGVGKHSEQRIFTLYSHEENQFAPGDVRLLEQLAQEAAFGMHLVETERQLAIANDHDPVTGLANEGLLLRRLDLAIEESKAGDHQLVVGVMAIGFRAIVDQWGMQSGQVMLQAVARVLAEDMGVHDTVGVLRGIRFGLLL